MSCTFHGAAECDWLSRAISMRRDRPVVTEFLQADLIDEASGTTKEIVWRAVALHSHCAPDSIPNSFYRHKGRKPLFELLDHDLPDASPQHRLFLNMYRAVRALQNGGLPCAWKRMNSSFATTRLSIWKSFANGLDALDCLS